MSRSRKTHIRIKRSSLSSVHLFGPDPGLLFEEPVWLNRLMTLLRVLRGKPRASAMYRTLRPSSDRATAFATSSGPIFDENKFSLAKTHTRNFDSYHNTNTVSSTASVFFF
jgi:hypothetical protein